MLGHKLRLKFFSLATGSAVAAALTFQPVPAAADAGFQKWIRDFRGTAVRGGVPAQTYDRAFANVRTPDAEVLRKARFQPEFRDEAW
ncbi:MAG: lytic murein transglycosylase, partial [Pseudomonadota bacterium]